jgi:hypothetical protein
VLPSIVLTPQLEVILFEIVPNVVLPTIVKFVYPWMLSSWTYVFSVCLLPVRMGSKRTTCPFARWIVNLMLMTSWWRWFLSSVVLPGSCGSVWSFWPGAPICCFSLVGSLRVSEVCISFELRSWHQFWCLIVLYIIYKSVLPNMVNETKRSPSDIEFKFTVCTLSSFRYDRGIVYLC